MPTIEPEIPAAPTGIEAVKEKAVGTIPQIIFTAVGTISGYFIATPLILLSSFSLGFIMLPAVALIIGLILGGWYTHVARKRGLAIIGVVSVLGVGASIVLAWIMSAIISNIH